MRGTLTLSIDSDLDHVGLVAKAVHALCSDLLPEDDANAIELSLVEVVTNVIRHGYGNERGRRLDVELTLGADRITIDVVDRAAPMPSSALDDASTRMFDFDETELAAIPESGMGLALVKMHMDTVQYHAGGSENRLRMTKSLRPGV